MRLLARLRAPRHARHVPRRGHEPLGPGDHRFGAGAARRQLAWLRRSVRRRRPITLQPGVIGAAANRRLAALRPQDRPRSGVDRCGDDRRHRRQQRERHVLRHGAEQLPHAGRTARRAGDGTVLDTRDAASRAAFREREPELVRALDAHGACDARQRSARGAHPPQVPAEEHDRLQPECAGRLRGSDRRARAPDDRLRRHARLHQRDHLRHRPGIRRQGERADPVRRSRDRVPGGDAAQEHAGRRGRARRSRGAALGGRQAGTARRHRRARSDTARRCWSRRVPRTRRRSPSRSARSRRRLPACRTFRAGALLDRSRRNARASGTCARACSRRWARCARSAPPSSSRTSPFRCRGSPKPRSTLQRLLAEHGYPDAIIFGHALEGNLHFVFTQDFNVAAEVERYRGFMDALCRMVVEKYDGSLKAEHGTGRNIAPFVELEWGAEAYAIMRAIKQLFDPRGLLNPGVIINDDRDAHLKNLKPLPAVRSDRRQVHRVRLLRTQVPVAQADAVAAPAHRRLARDLRVSSARARQARSSRRCARCTTFTASTPAPPADCAPPRARSASRPAC